MGPIEQFAAGPEGTLVSQSPPTVSAGAQLASEPFSGVFVTSNGKNRLRSAQPNILDGGPSSRLLLDSLSAGIVVVDRRGAALFANPAAELLLGVPLQSMTTAKAVRTDGSRLPRKYFPTFITLRTGIPQHGMTIGFPAVDGSITWTLVNADPIIDTQTGDLDGVVTSYADITEIYAAEQLIKHRLDLEELINQILESVRIETDSDIIQERATALVGRALKLTRCYYSTYDYDLDVVQRGQGWSSRTLPSMADMQNVSDLSWLLGKVYEEGVIIVNDFRAMNIHVDAAAYWEALSLRSAVAVPFAVEGRYVSAFVAGDSDPRVWTPDDVSVMKQVAALTLSAIEAARLRRRERNIAMQLQAAVQPDIPSTAEGLQLAHYYRPALEEAGVGGDFIDIFSGENGVTWLVVGDVSGKGLAAAKQVATIRNMLRFALYNGRTVVGPISALNSTLVQNKVVEGFATLIVAKYESGPRRITIANCGHEDGLLLSDGGDTVSFLGTTGSVIGAFMDSEYQEITMRLAIGDVIAFYTDGLSEAGVTRKKMIATDGIARLLEAGAPYGDPKDIVSHIMAGVDRFSRGIVRDDQALLAIRVTQ